MGIAFTRARWVSGITRLLVIAVILATSWGIKGCPMCDTETGKQVRERIVGDDFSRNLFAVLLPIPALVGVVAVIHFGFPGRREEREDDGN